MAHPEFPKFLDESYNQLLLPQRRLGIPQYEEALFWYREIIRKELDKKGFSFFPDIASAKDLIIPPGGMEFIPVDLPQEILDQFSQFHPYALSVLSATTRSRYAQAGLEVSEGGLIHNTITVRNLSQRPFALSNGEKFFYLYYWNGQVIRGEELTTLIGENETNAIRILGKEGEDWSKYYPPNMEQSPENLEGIEFMIDLKSRKYIPPATDPIRLHGGTAENHGRGMVDRYLSGPLPQQERPMLWISESSALLYLNKSVHGIVQWFVSDDNHDYQTNSVLFQGGNSSGKMRNEIWSPTTEKKIPKKVVMRFVRSNQQMLPTAA